MKRTFVFGGLSSALVVAVLAACSSSSTSSTPTNDAGDAAGEGSATRDDASASQDAADAAVKADYCPAVTAFFARCKRNSACDKALLAQCTDVHATISETYASANVECFPTQPCTPTGEPDTCVRSKLANAIPTPAQAKLATDFCAGCPGGATCTQDFYQIGSSAAADGVGVPILQSSDTIVGQISAQCLPVGGDAGNCKAMFADCAIGIIIDAQPADPPECEEE